MSKQKNLFQRILLFKLHYTCLPVLIVFAVLCCSLLAYLGKYFWFCDLFAHFKVQLFLTAIFCGLVLIIFAFFDKTKAKISPEDSEKTSDLKLHLNKKKLLFYAAFSFAVALVNLLEIAPLMLAPPTNGNNSHKLRIMHLNVHTANTRYQAVEDYIQEQNPDILLLEEVSPKWINNLRKILAKYPYSKIYPQDDNFGIAMFAKIKPNTSKVLHYGKYRLPYIKAEFPVGKQAVKIFGVHTIPPIGKARWEERNRMLGDLAKWVKEQKEQPTVILGDLNITPYSYFFKKLIKDGNLRNSQCGFGVQPSWPDQPFPLLIPIDHCLVTQDIKVSKRFIGPDVGSDHFPLRVDIQLPEVTNAESEITPK